MAKNCISRAKFSNSACKALLNDDGVQADLFARMERVRASADSMGSGKYKADVRSGKNRAHAMVKTTDIVSRNSNAKHNTLVRSFDRARG